MKDSKEIPTILFISNTSNSLRVLLPWEKAKTSFFSLALDCGLTQKCRSIFLGKIYEANSQGKSQ